MSNTRARKPGGGRKPSKPEYSASKNLAQQMKAAAGLYTDKMSLQAIADACPSTLSRFGSCSSQPGSTSRTRQSSSSRRSVLLEARKVIPLLSPLHGCLAVIPSSVTSYLPYEKGVYFPEEAEAANISAGAERQRHYRAVVALKKNPCEENLWKCVVAFRGYKFKTMSGLPFTYTLKKQGAMSSPRNCGSTAERTARALLGVLCCWRITISVKSER